MDRHGRFQQLTSHAGGGIIRLTNLLCALAGLAFFATHAFGQGTIEWTSPFLGTAFPKSDRKGHIEVKGKVDAKAGWSIKQVTVYTAKDGKTLSVTPMIVDAKDGRWPIDTKQQWKEINIGGTSGQEVEVWAVAQMANKAGVFVLIETKKVKVKVK